MFPFSEIVTACGCILFSSIKKIWLGVKKKKRGGCSGTPKHTYISFWPYDKNRDKSNIFVTLLLKGVDNNH
jgi:hypothetical protein